MSYIGIASTLGYVIEIPYIIRSLADSILPVSPEDFPLEFNPSFMRKLAYSGESQHVQIVESYHNPWWTWTHQPTAEQIMSNLSIALYIEHHRKFREPPEIYSIPPLPQHQFSNAAHPLCNQCFFNEEIAHRSILQIKALKESVMAVMQAYKGSLLISKSRLEYLQASCTPEKDSSISDLGICPGTEQSHTDDIKRYKDACSQCPEIESHKQHPSNWEEESVELSDEAWRDIASPNACSNGDRQSRITPVVDGCNDETSATQNPQNFSMSEDTPSRDQGSVAPGKTIDFGTDHHAILANVNNRHTYPVETNPSQLGFHPNTSSDILGCMLGNGQSSFQNGEGLQECLQQLKRHQSTSDLPSFDKDRFPKSVPDGKYCSFEEFDDGNDLHEIFTNFLNTLQEQLP